MAELLLYYKDPVKGYEIGDVVHILPDGSTWGPSECVDDFVVVRIPGMDLEEAQHLLHPLDRDTTWGLWSWDVDFMAPAIAEMQAQGIPLNFEEVARRRWLLDINASMSASGIDPDTFGMLYCEDWLVHEITSPIWVDKAAV